MSIANPLWGAPRIHGELLKLGIDVGQTTVAKYMAKTTRPPSQGWKTFLVNHADGIAAMDLFVVPTISFRLLYGFLILLHARRELLWLGVTAHPTAEWIAQQFTEAFGWRNAPRYVVVIGTAFMVPGSFSAFELWAFGIGRSHHARHGKMDMRRGSSARSDAIASTVSLSSASSIFAICCARIKGITMRGELICPYARRADPTRRPGQRPYRRRAHSGRIAPSIWAGLSFREGQPIQFLENNPIQSSLWVRFMCPKTRRNWLRLPIVRFHPGSSCPQQPP